MVATINQTERHGEKESKHTTSCERIQVLMLARIWNWYEASTSDIYQVQRERRTKETAAWPVSFCKWKAPTNRKQRGLRSSSDVTIEDGRGGVSLRVEQAFCETVGRTFCVQRLGPNKRESPYQIEHPHMAVSHSAVPSRATVCLSACWDHPSCCF